MNESLKTVIIASPGEEAPTVTATPQVELTKEMRIWKCILDTAAQNPEPRSFEHMSSFPLKARSLVVLQAVPVEGSIST